MLNKLHQLKLPIDLLVKDIQEQFDLKTEPIKTCTSLFLKPIKLEMVKDSKFVAAVIHYIDTLLKNPTEYGYLYVLWKKNMMIPLDIHFCGESAIEVNKHDEVVLELNNLAKKWAVENSIMYEITRLEILYFFVLILNPQLNWITVDFLLGGTRREGHAHLLADPSRLLRNKIKQCTTRPGGRPPD